MALQLLEQRTGTNGEYLPEATSDAADPTEYGSGYRYVSKGPFTNWAEKARADALDAHRKVVGKDANLHGVFFTVDRLDYPPAPTP